MDENSSSSFSKTSPKKDWNRTLARIEKASAQYSASKQMGMTIKSLKQGPVHKVRPRRVCVRTRRSYIPLGHSMDGGWRSCAPLAAEINSPNLWLRCQIPQQYQGQEPSDDIKSTLEATRFKAKSADNSKKDQQENQQQKSRIAARYVSVDRILDDEMNDPRNIYETNIEHWHLPPTWEGIRS